MKKILLSLCLLVAASASQVFATGAVQGSNDDLTEIVKGNKRFTVQVSTGEGGQIEIMGYGAISNNSVASATINTGENVQLIITPNKGYELKAFYVDGTDALANVADDGTYTITAIAKNMSISATFEKKTTTTKGDVNGDGEVNSVDVVSVYNVIQGSAAGLNADVNNDGEVNSVDVVEIYNIIAGAQ